VQVCGGDKALVFLWDHQDGSLVPSLYFQPAAGDAHCYHITTGKVPSYDRARLTSNWNPLSHDEDVRYLKQLEDVAKLFDEFTPGRSRQGILL
jgi:hypothetical protein